MVLVMPLDYPQPVDSLSVIDERSLVLCLGYAKPCVHIELEVPWGVLDLLNSCHFH